MVAFNCSWRNRNEMREPSFVWKTASKGWKFGVLSLHPLNQRLSIWQEENVADVPWILGQWILATFFSQRNRNEARREKGRTEGQEIGHWSSESSSKCCDWGHKYVSFSVPVTTPVLLRPTPWRFSRAPWERLLGRQMKGVRHHCWRRLPSLYSLFLKVPPWSWLPVFQVITLQKDYFWVIPLVFSCG